MSVRSHLRVLLAASLLAGACANPFAADPNVEAGPSRELAETPEDISASAAEEIAERSEKQRGEHTTDGDGTTGADAGSGDDGGDGSGDVQGSDGEVPSGPGPGATAAADDRSGDHGLRAPGYSDLRGVSVQDRGADLRIAVAFDADVPARLPDDETQGVGVDLFRGDAEESAYQVFVDGGPEGWFAYFTTPKGFKRYPGTFGLGGSVMVFDVPWSALNLSDSFRFSAFCDWSQRATGVVNLFAEDHAPDTGRAVFSPG